jgi:hypothetical protein
MRARSTKKDKPVHLRLPPEIFERIRAKAEAEGRPMNRVLINELRQFQELQHLPPLKDQIERMRIILKRFDTLFERLMR